jgi:signal transduction histidine kinase
VSAITQLRPDSSGSLDLALLLAAVEAFPGSLAVVESGIVVYVNPPWAQTFQYVDPLQIRGKPLDDFVPRQLFHSPMMGRTDVEEFTHLRRDGTQKPLRIAITGFRVWGKEFQVLSASCAGLQKQPATELGETQRLEAVGRLAGGVAHDFNNLLTGIMLYCDLLIAELQQDSRSHHHVQQIRRAGEHGAKVVQQLLWRAQKL